MDRNKNINFQFFSRFLDEKNGGRSNHTGHVVPQQLNQTFPDGELQKGVDGLPFFMLVYLCIKIMSTTTPLSYNTGSTISGTIQVGDLAVGTTDQDYSGNLGGVPWWMGPDEELGYVIAHPVSGNTQPTEIPGTFASLGFDRTKDFIDGSFINLAEYVTKKYSTPQTFSSATQASIWLTNNGFWNSYVLPVLSLDAGNPLSYSGSGNLWTDIISGNTFTLYNNPTYDSSNGGKIIFNASSNQFAMSPTSIPPMPAWTVAVWHYYDGTNTSLSPCIVTEKWPNSTGNLNYSLGSLNDNNPNLQTGFFNGGWRTTPVGYNLTPNNWYYIVGTYDGSDIKLYVNNSLVQTTSYTGSVVSGNQGIVLMRRWDDPPAGYWGGALATVDIYNRALTGVQISSIWNSTKSRFGY